jgi:glucose/mannose-6-phosphate isomerase
MASKEPEKGSMSKEIHLFVDHLGASINRKIEVKADFDRIMICGMGGSAIGGDIIRDCVLKEAKCPITVQRFPELPNWVDKRTFVIVSSYSGNTSETLNMYRQAAERGCRIVAITSGGEMERIGRERGDLVVKMEPGYQPRSALGLSLGLLAVIIDELCGTKSVQEIKKLLPSLYKLRDRLGGEKSEAWILANAIDGRVPIIYSTAGIYSSAIRWKSQINENSKMMAFAGSVPEFNHNEIAGWSEGELRSRCVPIFLYESSATITMKKMADAPMEKLKEYGQDVQVVRIRGKTALQRTLRAVMIGDYVSLYLALLNGVDPMDIRSIIEFKSRLNRLLDTVKQVGRPKKRK